MLKWLAEFERLGLGGGGTKLHADRGPQASARARESPPGSFRAHVCFIWDLA